MNVVRPQLSPPPAGEVVPPSAETDDERIVRLHAAALFRFVRSLGAPRAVAAGRQFVRTKNGYRIE